MQDTLKNADDLDKQSQELRTRAQEMRGRVIKSCDHQDMRLGLCGVDLLVECDECGQYALFELKDRSKREAGPYDKNVTATGDTFLGAIRRRFRSDTGLEESSQFAEILANRVRAARLDAFVEGASAGMQKAVELMNREQVPEWLEQSRQLARELWNQMPKCE